MNEHFNCPNCGSENVQSLPIIFQSGTSGSDSLTTTGKIISVTKGLTMTNLARSVAPPTKKKQSWWLTILFAFITLFVLDSNNTLFVLIGIAFTGIFLKENIDVKKYNEKIWSAKYEIWLHSYLCHRCGNVFVVR